MLDGGEDHVIIVAVINAGFRVVRVQEAVVRHPFPSDPEIRLARQYRDLQTSIAYVILLLVEFPKFRIEIAGFLFRAVLKRAARIARGKDGLMPRSLALSAIVGGALLYWRALQGWRTRPPVVPAQPVPKPRLSRSL